MLMQDHEPQLHALLQRYATIPVPVNNVMHSALAVLALALCLGSVATDDRVVVGFYSEALCPGCLILSNGPLNDAFEQIPDIFLLNYVPWGNAEIKWPNKIVCQHGKLECVMNTVSACVLYYYPNQTDFWPYLHCIDKHKEDQSLEKAEKCADNSNMDWDKINTCQSGKLGKDLELKYANITAQLNPPHKYTPWITIDGEHNPDAEDNGMIKEICKAYKGSKVPNACK